MILLILFMLIGGVGVVCAEDNETIGGDDPLDGASNGNSGDGDTDSDTDDDTDGDLENGGDNNNTSNTVPLVAAFDVDKVTGSAPLTVHFTDKSTGNVKSRNWIFGSTGKSSEEKDPTYIFTEPDDYTVKLVVTNETGATKEVTKTISVKQPVKYNVTIKASSVKGADPLKVDFSFDATFPKNEISKVEWRIDDSNEAWATSHTPSHTFEKVKTYTVHLKVLLAANDAIPTDSITITVTEPEDLIAKFSYAPTTANPLKISFTDESVGSPTIWEWDFGETDSNTKTSRNPEHTYAKIGTYTVTLKVKNGDGTIATTSKTISVTNGATATKTATPTATIEQRAATSTSTPTPTQVPTTTTTIPSDEIVPNPLDVVDELLRLLFAMLNPNSYAFVIGGFNK